MSHSVNPNLVVNNISNGPAIELLAAAQKHNLIQVVNNPVVCNYVLNKQQFETAARIFDPYLIRYGATIHNNHPVAALLNNFAYKQCQKEAERFSSVIDIGGSPLRTPFRHHICSLVNDVRTDARYTECAFSQLNLAHDKVDYTTYLTKYKHSLCLNGAQNCYFKADYAYSTNVYDITPENLVDIFINHNLLVYDLWMFLPVNLVNPHFSADTDIYCNRIVKKNKKLFCHFDLLDNSNIYIHNYENWRFYATHTVIKCANFSLVLEHKQNFSTFYQIRITRVESTFGDNTRMFKLSKLVDNIAVPDLYRYIVCGKMATDPYKHCFDLRSTYVKKAMSHGTSMHDSSFNYNNFSTYCNSIKNTVTFAANTSQEIIYQGIDPDPLQYEHIKISLFILCAVMRFKRTNGLSYAMNYMKDNVFPNSMLSIKRAWTKVCFFFRKQLASLFTDDVSFDIDEFFIYDVKFVLPLDLEFSDVLTFNKFNIFSKYSLGSGSIFKSESPLISSLMPPPSAPYPPTSASVSPASFTHTCVRKSPDKPPSLKPEPHTPPESSHAAPPSAPPRKVTFDDALSISSSLWSENSDLDYGDFDHAERLLLPQSFGHSINTSQFESTCNKVVVFNPPGDGRCGYHAIRYWFDIHRPTAQFVEPKFYEIYGTDQKIPFPKDWYDDECVALLCLYNKITVAIHQNGVFLHYVPGVTPMLSLNLQNAHWYVTQCNCDAHKNYYNKANFVGDYVDIPVGPINAARYIYVNCANDRLTDGAGQALAFRKLFGNYDQEIQKPIPTFFPLELKVGDDTYDLALCVAFKNDKKNKNYLETNKTLIKIFADLANLSKLTSKIVNLPLIGTGIYGADLCCFKTRLLEHDFPYRLCFQTKKSRDDYIATKPCKHYKPTGGYAPMCGAPIHSIVHQVSERASQFSLLDCHTPKNHMNIKFDDIMKVVYDHQEEYDLKPQKTVHDLTAAPGAWALNFQQYLIKQKQLEIETNWTEKPPVPPENYVSHVYVGQNHVAAYPNLKIDHQYHDTSNHLLNIKIDNSILLYDYMPSPEVLKNLLLHVKADLNNVLITKFDPYEDVDIQLKMNTISNSNLFALPFINEGSRTRSCEVYYLISFKGVIAKKPLVINTGTILKIKDDLYNESRVSAQCNCPKEKSYRSMINADVDVWYDVDPANYINDLVNSLSLFKSKDDTDRYRKELESIASRLKPKQTITLQLINGVAGCRKTQSVLKEHCISCAKLVAPFRRVVDSTKDNGGNANTFIKFLAQLLDKEPIPGTVLFDEFFATPPIYMHFIYNLLSEYYHGVDIITLGDDRQTIDKDFSSMGSNFKIVYRPSKTYITATYRMPQCVCDILKPYIPDIRSLSKTKGSFTCADLESISSVPYDKNNIILTSTHAAKNSIRKTTKAVVQTIAEVQGGTYTNVHVYTPDIEEIREDRVRHVYTAISRTSTNLVLHGTSESNKIFLNILQSPVDRMLEAFDVVPTPVDVIEKKPPKVAIHTTATSFKHTAATQEGVEEILDRIFIPTNNTSSDVIAYKSDCIPARPNKALLKLNVDYMATDDVAITGKKFSSKNYVQHYHPKNNSQTVTTAVTRYTKYKEKIPTEQIPKYVKGCEKFLKPDWAKFIRTKQSVEETMRFLANYLVELQKKYPKDKDLEAFADILLDENVTFAGSPLKKSKQIIVNVNTAEDDVLAPKPSTGILKGIIAKLVKSILDNEPNKISDLNKEWDERYHSLVAFHLKRQPKMILDKGFDSVYKAGQGISAWSKLLNILFSIVTRHFAKNFRYCLKDNVQLSYGKSDAKIALFFQPYAQHINSVNYKKLCADFSEFDSSQERRGIMSSLIMLSMCGYNQKILQFYLDKRTSWTLFSRSEHCEMPIKLFLDGHDMQHSGQPFTLDGNTLFNMSSIGMCYKFDDLAVAAFKGDDSFITAHNITPTIDGEQTNLDICGFKIKAHFVRVPEYIANIILPDGTFFPDTIRRVSRVISKVYTANSDWEEQRQSLTDSVDVIFDEERLAFGCSVASHYYSQFNIHITPDEIRYLLNFLHTLSTVDNIDNIPSKVWNIIHL